jgi:hypothetical protein
MPHTAEKGGYLNHDRSTHVPDGSGRDGATATVISQIAAASGFCIAAFSVAVTAIEIIESIEKDC